MHALVGDEHSFQIVSLCPTLNKVFLLLLLLRQGSTILVTVMSARGTYPITLVSTYSAELLAPIRFSVEGVKNEAAPMVYVWLPTVRGSCRCALKKDKKQSKINLYYKLLNEQLVITT